MDNKFIFIYANRAGKIKALILDEAKSRNNELLSDGWVHTQTLDICTFIEHLHDKSINGVDVSHEVLELNKKHP